MDSSEGMQFTNMLMLYVKSLKINFGFAPWLVNDIESTILVQRFSKYVLGGWGGKGYFEQVWGLLNPF